MKKAAKQRIYTSTKAEMKMPINTLRKETIADNDENMDRKMTANGYIFGCDAGRLFFGGVYGHQNVAVTTIVVSMLIFTEMANVY